MTPDQMRAEAVHLRRKRLRRNFDRAAQPLRGQIRKFDEDWKRYQASLEIGRLMLTRPQERYEPKEESTNGHHLDDPAAVQRLLQGEPDPNPSPDVIASRNRSVGPVSRN